MAATINIRLIVPLLYMGGLFALSSIPGDTADTPIEELLIWLPANLQNLLHIPVFAGLTGCWYWALSNRGSRKAVLLTASLLTLAYAIIDELYQTRVPGRYGSLTDLLFDSIGIVLALLAIARIKPTSAQPNG